MSQIEEKTQLREFKITTTTPGWENYMRMLLLQREEIIRRLKEASRDRTATKDTTLTIVGELNGFDAAAHVAVGLLRRYDDLVLEDLEKEKENHGT